MLAKPPYLTVIAAAALATIVSAVAQTDRSAIGPAQNSQKTSLPGDSGKIGFVIRQDLFDRNNPNNLRFDYPTPPAQPGSAR
jgi:hypothetical protein